MPIPKRKPVKKTNETDANEREEDIMNTDETKNESYVEENHENGQNLTATYKIK